MALDLDRLDRLMARMQSLGITELLYQHGEERIHLVAVGQRATTSAAADAAHAPETSGAPAVPTITTAANDRVIAAPMHGIFYLSPNPGAAPFVRVGDIVEAGAPLCIFEVMKTLSRLPSEFRCCIREILADDASHVAPGSPLFRVDPLDA